MNENVTKELTIGSDFQQIDQLEPFLSELRKEAGFDENLFPPIRLAVNEAVTNAITHGNKEDPSKKVHIFARTSDGKLVVSVKDEGSGFNPEELPDPLKEENLLKDSGRGIFLIKESADKVAFSKEGTKLVMTFFIDQ